MRLISRLHAPSVATLKGSATFGSSSPVNGLLFFASLAKRTVHLVDGSVAVISCGWRVSSMLFWVTAVARIERNCAHPTLLPSLNLQTLLLLTGRCLEFLC